MSSKWKQFNLESQFDFDVVLDIFENHMPILSQVDKKGGIEIFELLGEALKKQKIKI